MLYSLRKFSQDEIAKERLKIIDFYNQHGGKETKKFFSVSRQLISVWKRKLKEAGHLTGLVPFSTKPYHFRQPETDLRIIEEIKRLRDEHYRLGKEKLKPEIDSFCQKNGLSLVSISTIGRVLKRHDYFKQRKLTGKVYHNPDSKWAKNEVKRKKRLRVSNCPHYQDFGHIQADTVEKIVDGVKGYFYQAIDTKMKFALSLYYPRLNSQNSTDFYQKFKTVYPGRIIDWQSDNGQENLKYLDRELDEEKITHLFSYPHCPKINAFVERFNRTVEEEFIDPNLDLLVTDQKLFMEKLALYNIWYNTRRVHKSLGNISPLDYFLLKGGMSKKSWTYTTS